MSDEWKVSGDYWNPWPHQGQKCPNCGEWYYGWTHYCSKTTVSPSVWVYPQIIAEEKEMDKVKVVSKISSVLGLLSSIDAMSDHFNDHPEDFKTWVESLIKLSKSQLEEALEEMIRD